MGQLSDFDMGRANVLTDVMERVVASHSTDDIRDWCISELSKMFAESTRILGGTNVRS
jgi:hypothetical protein